MGQALRGVPEAPALDAGRGGAPFSIGAYLARQRSLRGISLEDLEVATRIPRRSLERLEAGAFDRDRDAFARGFVKTVAQALGLDVHDTVMRMLDEVAPRRRSRTAWLRGRRMRALLALLVAGGAVASVLAWRGVPSVRPSFGWMRPAPRPVVEAPDPVRALAREARARAGLVAPPSAPPPDARVEPAAPAAPAAAR